jgi:hypothetical protein
MAQEKSYKWKRIPRRCLAGNLLIILSLFTCSPAFAAKFEKTYDDVRVEGDAPGVKITILDYFGHPVGESAVVRLKNGRAFYRVKYNGLFKVQVRDLTEAELKQIEVEDLKRRIRELEQQRFLSPPPTSPVAPRFPSGR